MNAQDISRYWWLQDIIRYLHISPVGLKTVATATAGHDMFSLQDPHIHFVSNPLDSWKVVFFWSVCGRCAPKKKQQPFDSKIFWRKSQVSITGPSNSVPDLGSHEVPATCWGGMSFRSSHLVEFTYVHLILNGKLQIRLPNLVWMCFCMSLHCDNTYGHMVMNMAGEYSNKTLLSCFGTLRSPYSWTCSA
jgi:hypothetical protein